MRKSGFLVREVDNEVLVLDTESDQIHQLNASASVIWRMHGNGATAEEIAGALELAFDVGAATVLKDVRETLKKFGDLGLVAPDDDLEEICRVSAY